jgi:hypothetical protein
VTNRTDATDVDVPVSYFFLTDGPPLRENAFGNHAIAANLIVVMQAEFKLVISRRLRRRVRWREVQDASAVPVLLYPDAAILGFRAISQGASELLDISGAALATFPVRRRAKELRPRRFFVLVGGNGWFLVAVWLMMRATGLPFDIYLVDDLEDSAVLWRQVVLRRLIRTLEGNVLRRAARIFCISKGYAEHIARKYGVTASWLPVPIVTSALTHRPYRPSQPDLRRIVFVGSGITPLYLTALVDCYQAIQERNARCGDYRLQLLVITIAAAQPLVDRLPNTDDLVTLVQPPRAELQRCCEQGWATLLPYSFDSSVRKLVSTSFSSKLSDSFRAGRPVLVYGPSDASIPRYFRETGLPLCATSREELSLALDSIERYDSPELVTQYAAVWSRYHSPSAVRETILGISESEFTDQSKN